MYTKVSSDVYFGDGEKTVRQFLYKYGKRDGFSIIDNPEFTYLFLEPVLKIWADKNGSYVKDHRGMYLRFENPWEALESEMVLNLQKLQSDVDCPCVAGFFAYEFLHECEEVSAARVNETKVPYYVFFAYKTVIKLAVEPAVKSEVFQFDIGRQALWKMDAAEDEFSLSLAEFESSNLEDESRKTNNRDITNDIAGFSNFDKSEYLRAVRDIQEQIRAGQVYQVNLSQQFTLPYFGRPEIFASILRSICPSPQGAFFSVRSVPGYESFTVVSASPELFFSCTGNTLRCSPIKGTRPRYLEAEADHHARQELLSSVKDHAELSMIVDLVRNDMGRIAEVGSVKVESHARLESHPNVHHLVSDITCRIPKSITFINLIKAMFPCGSITGAPKIAAMQAISKFEGNTRGVYTGAIGYLGANGMYNFNVAIRTALLRDGFLTINSGGGVVIDSDPESEYEETIVKLKGLFQAWKLALELERASDNLETAALSANSY